MMKSKNKVTRERLKRVRSAYNFFFRAERAKVLGLSEDKLHIIQDGQKRKHRKTQGMIGFANLASRVGEKWKALSDEEKQPYILKSIEDRERYQRELKIKKLKLSFDPRAIASETANSNLRELTRSFKDRKFTNTSSLLSVEDKLEGEYVNRNFGSWYNVRFHDDFEPIPIKRMSKNRRHSGDFEDFLEICSRDQWVKCLLGEVGS